MCNFNLLHLENSALHVVHLNTFFSVLWTFSMCFVNNLVVKKLASQVEQLNGFFPSWTECICLCNPFYQDSRVMAIVEFRTETVMDHAHMKLQKTK